jgi:hypothetical protein
MRRGRCVAQTRDNRHRPACTRSEPAGSMTLLEPAGTDGDRERAAAT